MEFRGTKGRWNCVVDENYSDVYQVIGEPNSSTFGEQHYNAQLISSAPELLDFMIELYNDTETHSMMFPSQQVKLKELIEKATNTESK